jgi:hypothetical protein
VPLDPDQVRVEVVRGRGRGRGRGRDERGLHLAADSREQSTRATKQHLGDRTDAPSSTTPPLRTGIVVSVWV